MKKLLLLFLIGFSVCQAQEAPTIRYTQVGNDYFNGQYVNFWFNSTPNKYYEIQTSTNLVDWIKYGEVKADGTDTLVRVYDDFCTKQRQFVRLKLK